jgi:hypothetical protein
VSRRDAARASAEQHATAEPRASWRRGWAFAFFAFAARVLLAFTAAAWRCARTAAGTCAGFAGAFFFGFGLPADVFGFAAFAFAACGFFTTAHRPPASRRSGQPPGRPSLPAPTPPRWTP